MTSIVVTLAHCPASGVKTYVAVAVLLTNAGIQDPVILFVEVVNKVGAVLPEQIGAITSNDGIVSELTVTSTVSVAVQPAVLVAITVYVPDVAGITLAVLVTPFIEPPLVATHE